MKRKIILLIVITIFLSLAFTVKPAIIFLVKKQIKNTFPESRVYVGGCVLKPLSMVSLSKIRITRDGAYDFNIGKAAVYYDINKLLKMKIAKVYLGQADIRIGLGNKSIGEFINYLKAGEKSTITMLFETAELVDLKLELKSKEVCAAANLSIAVNLIRGNLNYCHLNINSLESNGITLEGLSLNSNPNTQGEFYIKQIKFKKAVIEEARAKLKIISRGLYLEDFSVKAFLGKVEGSLSLIIKKNPEYSLQFKIVNLDIDSLLEGLELKKKLQMTGKLQGELNLKGMGLSLDVVDGNFTCLEPGGVLAVQDTALLENIASRSGKGLDIIVEGFKNYHYNIGKMRLFEQERDLVFETNLDGKEGKRSLLITAHDFLNGG